MAQAVIIPLRFGGKWLVFFMVLETLTVPLVALSNTIASRSLLYISIMGFLVAFLALMILGKALHKLFIKYSHNLLGLSFTEISGLWWLGILAGILEMIMFIVQSLLFAQGFSDVSTGFISAFISVGATLVFYESIAKLTPLALYLHQDTVRWQIHFAGLDIIFLTILFSCYEAVACPLTGLWIPVHTHRFLMSIASGIIGGGAGGLLLYLVSFLLPIHARLTLRNNKKDA